MRGFRLWMIVLCMLPQILFSQEISDNPSPVPEAVEDDVQTETLPTSYRGIQFGMDIDEVQERLLKDSVFGFRGQPDVSLLPFKNSTLIETNGSFFLSRCWFQFYDDKLYIMIFKLNTDKVDYFSMYSSLVQKYGEPQEINPERVVWQNEAVQLILERPLTVKFIDRGVFDSIVEKGEKAENATKIYKENFINSF